MAVRVFSCMLCYKLSSSSCSLDDMERQRVAALKWATKVTTLDSALLFLIIFKWLIWLMLLLWLMHLWFCTSWNLITGYLPYQLISMDCVAIFSVSVLSKNLQPKSRKIPTFRTWFIGYSHVSSKIPVQYAAIAELQCLTAIWVLFRASQEWRVNMDNS